jgi:lysozyme family protein
MPTSTRSDLIAARNVLARRRANTADTAEQATIDEALSQLNDAIEDIDLASLLQAAGIVARATDALEGVVASARMGPFDTFLGDMQQAIGRLNARLDEMQASERLPPAPLETGALPDEAAPVASTRGAPAAEATAPPAGTATPPRSPTIPPPTPAAEDAIPRPIHSRKFADLRDEYASFYDRCRVRPEFAPNVDFYVSRLTKFKPTYLQVATSLGIPWVFIGIVHGMECGFNFGTHLHNGDPLSARTVRVPKGRPPAGEPPFTWLESARDALMLKRLHEVTDWSLPHLLYLLEAYNGFGYRPRGIPTPYLWSFSTLYRSGKFVADGVFDPNAVSKQCGAALMLRTLQERGAV